MQSRNKAFDEWIKNQPIWRDSDLIKFVIVASIVSGAIGFLFGYMAGLPDLSGITYTGLRG
jgi:hypothetical protein